MKKLLVWCTVIYLISFFADPAVASLTLYSVEGTWSNTIGGDNINYYSDIYVAYGNHYEDQVWWGVNVGNGQSGLGFTGVAPPSTSFNIGEAFEIGQLRHFNNTIAGGSAADSTDLAVTLTFTEPDISQTFNFTFNINETPNIDGPVDDFIYFPSSYPEETFEIDGQLYTLQLLGFGSDPDNLVDQFQSPEGGTNSILLWGMITTPQVIPAPGAIVLGGIGVSIVGWLRRRRTV